MPANISRGVRMATEGGTGRGVARLARFAGQAHQLVLLPGLVQGSGSWIGLKVVPTQSSGSRVGRPKRPDSIQSGPSVRNTSPRDTTAIDIALEPNRVVIRDAHAGNKNGPSAPRSGGSSNWVVAYPSPAPDDNPMSNCHQPCNWCKATTCN